MAVSRELSFGNSCGDAAGSDAIAANHLAASCRSGVSGGCVADLLCCNIGAMLCHNVCTRRTAVL